MSREPLHAPLPAPVARATWSLDEGKLVLYDCGLARLLRFAPAQLSHALFMAQVDIDGICTGQMADCAFFRKCRLVCQDGSSVSVDVHSTRRELWWEWAMTWPEGALQKGATNWVWEGRNRGRRPQPWDRQSFSWRYRAVKKSPQQSFAAPSEVTEPLFCQRHATRAVARGD